MAVQPLTVPPGVMRGATPAQSAGRWYDTNLVRWVNGVLTPVGGWQRITTSATTKPVRALLPWLDNTSTQRLAAATDTQLLVYSADSVFDATPVGLVTPDQNITLTGYGTNTYGGWDYGAGRPSTSLAGLSLADRPYSFSLDNFGQNLVYVASSDGRLFQYSPSTPTTVAAVVGTAPVSNRAVVVTAERHVMLLGVAGNPRRFGWCSQEDITDWNFASTTNTAGYLDIDSEGILMTARVVREGVLLFTESDVWLARYVGTPFIYSVERIGFADGPVGPMAVAEFAGRCVWMGRRGFWIYEGGYVKPLPCEVNDYVFSNLSPYAKFRVCAADNGVFGEVWFNYPSGSLTENDRYVVWNYEENWWAIGSQARGARCPAGVYPYPLAAANDDNHIYYHETGWTANGISRNGTVYAETGTMSLGERFTNVMQLQADSGQGYASTKFTLYGAPTPEGTYTTYGSYTPRSDGYCDVRLQAREIRLRVEQVGDTDWGIGRMYVHGKAGGRR